MREYVCIYVRVYTYMYIPTFIRWPCDITQKDDDTFVHVNERMNPNTHPYAYIYTYIHTQPAGYSFLPVSTQTNIHTYIHSQNGIICGGDGVSLATVRGALAFFQRQGAISRT